MIVFTTAGDVLPLRTRTTAQNISSTFQKIELCVVSLAVSSMLTVVPLLLLDLPM